MGNRLAMHNLFISIAGPNVYYQPPTGLIMKFPAIKYEMKKIENEYANNSVYYQKKSYTITVISKVVDDNIVSIISNLPLCKFDRQYISDNLYHTVFDMYY